MVRFDKALEVGLATIREKLGDRKTSITFVRDVAGQITAVLRDDALADGEWSSLAHALDSRLGAFSPGSQRVLLRQSNLIDKEDVLESPDRVLVPDEDDVWVVDRLLTNQDWLRRPMVTEASLPLAVSYSLKGGVGRSTALSVLAWHLARQGKRVLAIDLDLEAPGLGNLLLEDLPDYGLIDWLVEALAGQSDPLLLQDCLGLSPVAKDAVGTIQVLPAFGQKTREYVAKVGRVFLPGIDADGAELGLAARLNGLLSAVRERHESPDVVLLDARAGLHDIGAAAVTQLGADVFLFARDEPQSWQACSLLFNHLASSKGVQFGMRDEDLRWRMKMVAALVDKTEAAMESWIEASYETWSALYDDESKVPGSGLVAQTFARDDSDAPHYPLPIYFDDTLRGVTLVGEKRPAWLGVESAFGEFLRHVESRLFTRPESAEHDLGGPQ